MKKEYCIIKEENRYYKKLVNISYRFRTGCGSIKDANDEIGIQWTSVWKVLLETGERPRKIVADIQQYCITNNEIRFENEDDYSNWRKEEKDNIIGKIGEYVHSLGYEYRYDKRYSEIKPPERYKYMTDDTGDELFFLSELDAFNYLSKNGGWYLDHIVPIRFDGEYGGPISSTYIMARDIEE